MLNPILILSKVSAAIPASLTRNTLGRLAALDSSPISGITAAFNTSDWVAPTGVTLSLASGKLRSSGTNTFTRQLRYTAAGTLADCFIHEVSDISTLSGAGVGPSARIPAGASPTSAITLQVPVFASGTEQLVERVSGSIIQADATVGILNAVPVRSRLEVIGATARARVFGGSLRSLSGIGLTGADSPGAYHSVNGWIERLSWYLMRSATLRVNGPSANTWKAQIRDNSNVLLAEVSGTAGIADIDLFDITFPDARVLEIRNVSTDALIVSATPSEGIWGGDEWTWS